MIRARLVARPAVECWSVMRRKLFTLCSALSLLLCVAVCVLWMQSYRVRDELVRSSYDDAPEIPLELQHHLALENGVIMLAHTSKSGLRMLNENGRPMYLDEIPPPEWHYSREQLKTDAAPPLGGGFWRRLGFSAAAREFWVTESVIEWKVVTFPCWVVLPPLAAPSALTLLAARKRRRRSRASQCASCGYDLRATPDRCPECGSQTPKLAAA